MDQSILITLVKGERYQDDLGVWQSRSTRRDVFAQVDSITRDEFFEGGRNGLNPEYRFRMFFGDYQGEDELVYEGKTYAIYRTYKRRTDTLELYVERKGGTNEGHA